MTAVAGTEPLWMVVLQDASWVLIRAENAEQAVKRLTRAKRRKVSYVRRSRPTSEWRQLIEDGEVPTGGRKRR